MNEKILIVIPTYNERENIEKLLGRLLNIEPKLEMLVVDDNSPDGTGKLVDEIASSHARVHIKHRPFKEGIGPAYVDGFKWGLEHGFEIIIEMDADLSHRPRYIQTFLRKLKEYDLVAGSRWIKGGSVSNWSMQRVLLSRTANLYASTVLGGKITDWTGGFNAYRRSVLEKIDLDQVHSDGYSFQIEMKYRSLQNGFRVTEIPIVFTDRKAGESKISKHIILEALFVVWRLRFFVHKSS